MSHIRHGFLAKSIEEVRIEIQQSYSIYREALMRLNEQCVATQYELSIKANEASDILAAAYFMRTIASTQAAVILLEYGLLSQAKTVLRSSLESLFALAAIEKKPELAFALAQSQEANKRSIADKMLMWEGVELQSSRDNRISKEKLLEFKSSRVPEFTTWQLAVEAEMTDWYRSLYSLLSQPAHATVSDIISHLVTDDEGNISELKNEPQIKGQAATWMFVMEIQLRAAKVVTAIFRVNSIDISTHENALRSLAA